MPNTIDLQPFKDLTQLLDRLPLTEYTCEYYGTEDEDDCAYCLNERAKEVIKRLEGDKL